jgi:hypothetical protein
LTSDLSSHVGMSQPKDVKSIQKSSNQQPGACNN